jgi:Putative MetA-pathway of phenol degradation
MTRRLANAVVILGLVSATAESQDNPHAVQPERPTVNTPAAIVAPGWFELETGVERDRLDRASSIGTPITLKLGIASHVQLSIWGSVPRPDSSSFGVGDLFTGIKWRVLDDAKVIGDFALLPSIKFPTGSATAGRGTGTTDASLLLISSHKFDEVSMDLNLGYTRRSGNGSRAPLGSSLWTIALGGPVVRALGWTGELYGYPTTAGPAGQPAIVAFLGGPTYQPAEWLALDVGVIVPFAGPQPHALYAGAVWNVGKVW